jgi:hypothetical protein
MRVMRLLPIFFLMFSCVAYGQELNNLKRPRTAEDLDRILSGIDTQIKNECELPKVFKGEESLNEYLSKLVAMNTRFPSGKRAVVVVILKVNQKTGKIDFDLDKHLVTVSKEKDDDIPFYNALLRAIGRSVSLIDYIPFELAELSNGYATLTLYTDDKCFGKAASLELDIRKFYGGDSKIKRESASSDKKKLTLTVEHRQIDGDGMFVFEVKTGVDTASLKINGEEQGGKFDGNYSLKRVARAGLESHFVIDAIDLYGNKASEKIVINRSIAESTKKFIALNPAKIKKETERNAVAIIIGIQNYRQISKSDFSNDDARIFYDYAIRALGIKTENIKMLIDEQAGQLEIYKALDQWLPTKVTKQKTDVYVFYSGHGLPSYDGKSLYLLPHSSDKDYLSKTAIDLQELILSLQSVQSKSVTIFMDACYSGQARSGETLVANARPVTLKAEKKLFPDNFTVITASQADQISSSSPDLKHGIFSYYLMKGMEGDADANNDGKITLGEMQAYLVDNVGRQAGMMSRKQEPQLIGDVGRVLVGR